MKIGYQGIEGSNSEEASLRFIEKLGLENIELVPLVDSYNVVNELKNGNIDYGVMAVKNSKGGTVKETDEALNNIELDLLSEENVHIHHFLYKKKGVDNSRITKVASHPQALIQTKDKRKELFSHLEEMETADTALSAKELMENILDETIAVICSKKAGIIYDLELLYENLEDSLENFTNFGLYKIKD